MFSDSFYVMLALLRRDIKVILKSMKDKFINDAIFVGLQIVVYGRLYPFFGFAKEDLMGIILGAVAFSFPLIVFVKSYDLFADLQDNRLIDFEVGLPLSGRWLATKYALSFTLHLLMSSFPLFIFTKLLMWNDLDLTNMSIVSFISVYIVSSLFLSLLFLYLLFKLDFDGFMVNLWPRILMPLMFLGPSFYSWKNVADVLPMLSKLILLNPMTYFIEGIRRSILGGEKFLPVYLCVSALILFISLFAVLFEKEFIKRLDSIGRRS